MRLQNFVLLGSALLSVSYAGIQPHNEPIISNYPPKPNVLLMMDDSATMTIADMPGGRSRNSVLQEVAQDLIIQYRNRAYLGVSGLGYVSPESSLSFWKSGARRPLKMAISDLSTHNSDDLNYNKALNLVRNFPSDGNTPLAFSLYEGTKYFRGLPIFAGYNRADKIFDEAHHPVQYRCQQNHVIVLSDSRGAIVDGVYGKVKQDTSGGEVQLTAASTLSDVAKKMWEDMDLRDYPPTTKPLAHLATKDKAGKPWKDPDMPFARKMPIYFHGIFFGFDPDGEAAYAEMERAASFGSGVVTKANDLTALHSGFNKIFQSIISTRSGTGAFEDQLTQTKDTVRYSSHYDPVTWTGAIHATKFDPTLKGFSNKANEIAWSTDDTIKPNQGKFYTFDGMKQVTLTNEHLGSPRELDYAAWLKGNAIEGLRVRPKPLGDIINSHLVYAAKDHLYINSEEIGAEAKQGFFDYLLHKDRTFKPNLIIAGSNDGLLNFIIADKNNNNHKGERYFTYFPSFFNEELPQIAALDYVHNYKADGSTALFDALVGSGSYLKYKTLGLTMMAAGKRGFIGYELFSSDTNFNPLITGGINVNFEKSNESPGYGDLGYTYSDVEFFNQKSAQGLMRAVAVMGNGFGAIQENGRENTRSVVYLIDMEDGTPLKTIVLDETGYGAASPALVVGKDVETGYQQLEALYVGDYSGKFYKVTFDTQNTDKRFALELLGKPQILFDANGRDNPYKTDSTAKNAFPITVKPALMKHPENDGIWVYFGTGMAVDKTAHRGPESKVVQAFYGLKDSNATTAFSQLTKQTLTGNIPLTKDSTVDLEDNVDLYASMTSATPLDKGARGWYLPLHDNDRPFNKAITGERIILPAQVFNASAVHFATWGILEGEGGNDPCIGDTIFGRAMFLDLFSGQSIKMDGADQAGILLMNDAPGMGTAPSLQAGNTLAGHRTGGAPLEPQLVELLHKQNSIIDKETSYPREPANFGSDRFETVSFGTYKGGLVSGKIPLNGQPQVKKRVYFDRKI